MNQRDRLIARVAKAALWGRSTENDKNYATWIARAVVDDLLAAPADGKAVERTLRALERSA